MEYKKTDQLCSYQKSLLYKISQRYKNQKCYLLLYTHYYNYISKGLWEKTGKTKWVTESTPCSNETSFGCHLKWPMFCLFDFALVMALLWRQIAKIYSLGLCFESFDEIVFKEKKRFWRFLFRIWMMSEIFTCMGYNVQNFLFLLNKKGL